MIRPAGLIAVSLVLAASCAVPALGDDVARKHAVDAQIAALQGRLSSARRSEDALRGRIDALSNRIGGLEEQVGGVTAHLATLQQDLALRRRRLADLTQLYRLQTQHLRQLRRQYALAVRRLNLRLVAIYESGTPSTLDFVLGASSLDDVLEKVDFANLIGEEDRNIAAEVKRSKLELQRQRGETRTLRLKVLGDERALAARAAQVAETRSALLGARDQLARTKQAQVSNLSKLSAKDRALAKEIEGEQAASAALGAAIRAAQERAAAAAAAQAQAQAGTQTPAEPAPAATPSSAGFIWPVNGPITSPFGPRWGSFHPGIDIGVPEGTPIEAAAAGTVIYCGWESGYGNLVVIDHGGDLATAYGHQSRIAVTCGEHVAQGQVIGYVGCTGFCTGPHVHFEVRINGQPVDPMGYLP